MEYEFHELADLFPLLGASELQELAEDIRVNGQNEPVVLYDGKILDGRNRYLACRIAGVKPTFKEYAGNDPLRFVISANLKRRHLSPSQCAALAVELLPVLEAEAKKRQGTRTDLNITENFPESVGESREHAASLVGSNPHSISDAKAVKDQAPDLFKKIQAGDITVHRAKREVNNRKREEQRKNAIVAPATVSPDLYVGLAEDLHMLPSGSIDLIITSPPYNLGKDTWPMGGEGRTSRVGIGYEDQRDEEYYQTWQLDCLVEWFRVTADGGSLLYNHKPRIKEGHCIHPLQWLLNSRNPWTFRQEIIWDRGTTHNHNSKLFWPEDERIYWLVKGERPILPDRPIGMSTIWKEFGPIADQSWHPAPFTPALPHMIIEAIGRSGITVLDPFAGSCTTLRVALEYGYNAIGVDISGEYLETAAKENGWTKPSI